MARWQGGLINRISEGAAVTSVPKVGDGATLYLYSDRHAYTVTDVTVSPSGKTITVTATRDQARRTDSNGMGDSQSYDYTPDPHGNRIRAKSVSGKPFRVLYFDPKPGDDREWPDGSLRMGDTFLRVGFRDEFYDFSF